MRPLFLPFILLLSTLNVHAKKVDEDAEEGKKVEDASKAIDRLAVNLAGAFVKTMFPEMDRKEKTEKSEQEDESSPPIQQNNIRRAPQRFDQLSGLQGYSADQASSMYNAIPQLSNSPANPFSSLSGGNLPMQVSIPQDYQLVPKSAGSSVSTIGGIPVNTGSEQSLLQLPTLPETLTAGNGGMSSLNAVRNQQYLAKLARHQQELNEYSAKQLEYLDQQRRYQQAMIDHQAGAALLLQQQQQEVLNKQLQRFEPHTPEEHLPDNTVGGRILTETARGIKRKQANHPVQEPTMDDELTSDSQLREYFATHYGIDIPKDGGALSADERETLKMLKRELLTNKAKAIKDGAFKTLDKFRPKAKAAKAWKAKRARAHSAKTHSSACPECRAIDVKMLKGAWTQIYGPPSVIKSTFSTLLSLNKLELNKAKKVTTASLSTSEASCVGLEIGRLQNGISELNLFFRDSEVGSELHEMRGRLRKDRGSIVTIDAELYHNRLCLVKSGPSEADQYEYVIFTEISGPNACKAYSIYARNVDEFNRRHFDDVNEFMKQAIESGTAMPAAALPKAQLCELDRP